MDQLGEADGKVAAAGRPRSRSSSDGARKFIQIKHRYSGPAYELFRQKLMTGSASDEWVDGAVSILEKQIGELNAAVQSALDKITEYCDKAGGLCEDAGGMAVKMLNVEVHACGILIDCVMFFGLICRAQDKLVGDYSKERSGADEDGNKRKICASSHSQNDKRAKPNEDIAAEMEARGDALSNSTINVKSEWDVDAESCVSSLSSNSPIVDTDEIISKIASKVTKDCKTVGAQLSALREGGYFRDQKWTDLVEKILQIPDLLKQLMGKIIQIVHFTKKDESEHKFATKLESHSSDQSHHSRDIKV